MKQELKRPDPNGDHDDHHQRFAAKAVRGIGLAVCYCMADPRENSFFKPIQQSFVILVLSIGVIAACAALYSTRWILLAALIGVGLGVLIAPAMYFLKDRLKIPRGISAFLFFALFVGLMAALGYGAYLMISSQLVPLFERGPELAQSAQQAISDWLERVPWLQRQLGKFNFGAAMQNFTQWLLSGLTLGASAMAGILFIFTIALYYAVSPSTYTTGLLSIFPSYLRPRLNADLGACGSALRQWFVAQLIAAAIVGGTTGLVLWAIGIDYWLPFGLLTLALDFIPYIGPIIAAGTISLITLGTEPDKVIWVMVAFVALQQFEGDLVIPMVMKGRVELPPIQLLTLMLMFGVWFGFLGIFIAPPVMTVLRTLLIREYIPWMNSRTQPIYMEQPKPEEVPSETMEKSA